MELNLSPGPLINAGGAFLFLVAGIGILAVARQTRLGLRLGLFATTFGLAYVAGNLVSDRDPASTAMLVVVGLAPAVVLVFLILEIMRQVSSSARAGIALLATLLGLASAIAAVVYLVGFLEKPALWETFGADLLVEFPLAYLVEPLLLVLLAACAQAPVNGTGQNYKGRLLVGLAAGLFAIGIIMVTAASNNQETSWVGRAQEGVQILLGIGVACVAWLVVRGHPAGTERFAHGSFAAIVMVGLIGSLGAFADWAQDIGPFGIMRTVGAVLLVLAVVKYDVLGVPLPRLVVRRGALAGGALAVLFIVAQVAQNFFSAKYGLLMGGVLAGGFVFAASPIQRAIERSTEPQKATAAAFDAARVGYKAALRAAMRDGTLTRREERHLAEVAMALGITPVQALDLRDEVEREGA